MIILMPKILLVLLDRPPRLTESQLKVLADIGVAAGQLSAASMILPFVIPGLDKTKLSMIAWGIAATALFWVGGVLLSRKIKS